MASGSNLKVSFLLLCHEPADLVINKLKQPYFYSGLCNVIIHYDKSKPKSEFQKLKQFTDKHKKFTLVEDNLNCKWGEFSLVEATLKMMSLAVNSDSQPDFCYLISFSCLPVKSFKSLQNYLDKNKNFDFIEATDISKDKWVHDGYEEERYNYYYPFNYRTSNWKFEKLKWLQEKLKVKRTIPSGYRIHFGSQWFCLRRNTCHLILKSFEYKDLKSFFKWSWIPDEFAIQTIVGTRIPFNELKNFTLTYYQFNSLGIPLTLYNDHKDWLKTLNYFFARKASLLATDLNALQNFTPKIDSDRIGVKSAKYEIYKSQQMDFSRGGKIGRVGDIWKDGIEKNYKKFYIVTGPCKYYIRALNEVLREEKDLTVFDYVFDIGSCEIRENADEYAGFSKLDLKRLEYDPAAFLYQLIHSNTSEVVVSIDNRNTKYIKELIRWSYEANIIITDPFKGDKVKSCISRLTNSEAGDFLNEPGKDLPRLMDSYFQNEDLYYWQRNIQDANANVNFLEYRNDRISKLYQSAISDIDLSSVLPENVFSLLQHYESR